MLRCYHKIDNGLEMSCQRPDHVVVFARFRFHFIDGLLTGQNYSLRSSEFLEEMEGFSRYCLGFVRCSFKGLKFPDRWIEPRSEYVEYDLQFTD